MASVEQELMGRRTVPTWRISDPFVIDEKWLFGARRVWKRIDCSICYKDFRKGDVVAWPPKEDSPLERQYEVAHWECRQREIQP